MQLRYKVTLFIIFVLIPAPNIEFSFELDLDNDGKSDIIIKYEEKEIKITKSYFQEKLKIK